MPESAPRPPTVPATGTRTAADAPVQHLMIPYAVASAEACLAQLRALPLPALEALLRLPHRRTVDAGSDHDFSLPHERVRARALGWVSADANPATIDGRLPLAAAHTGVHGQPCAWFSPCHWQVGMEQVRLLPADALDLDDTASRALMAALAPYAAEDGIALRWVDAGHWLAQGEPLRHLATASLDRVAHRRVDAWMPRGEGAPQLLRLQNEAQMLFHLQPLNDAREAAGALPVNGFWAWGTGVLAEPMHTAVDTAVHAPVHTISGLREPALQGDWARWQAEWQRLDAESLAPWLASLRAGAAGVLILGGERSAVSLHVSTAGERSATGASWSARLREAWRRWARGQPPVSALAQLAAEAAL